MKETTILIDGDSLIYYEMGKPTLEDFDVTDREPNAAGGLAGILKL